MKILKNLIFSHPLKYFFIHFQLKQNKTTLLTKWKLLQSINSRDIPITSRHNKDQANKKLISICFDSCNSAYKLVINIMYALSHSLSSFSSVLNLHITYALYLHIHVHTFSWFPTRRTECMYVGTCNVNCFMRILNFLGKFRQFFFFFASRIFKE